MTIVSEVTSLRYNRLIFMWATDHPVSPDPADHTPHTETPHPAAALQWTTARFHLLRL